MKLQVPFTVSDDALLPSYAHEDDAGMDLRADIEKDVTLLPGDILLVPTGLSLQIPSGWVGMVVPRSGLACKRGVTVVNSPGIIDASYRGVLHVGLINLGNQPETIHPRDRIAQLLVLGVPELDLMRVTQLGESDRGTDGFGSSGVK